MTEWLKVHAWKVCVSSNGHRGFKSHPLRQKIGIIFTASSGVSRYSDSMQPTFNAMRAITFVLFRRIFLPIAWIVGGILATVWGSIIALALLVHSSWLWAFVIIIPVTLVALAILWATWLASGRLAPKSMTRDERKFIQGFSDKVIRIAETRATPLPVIALLIAKDVARGKKSSYVESLIADTKSLKGDFEVIRRMGEE